MKLVSLVATFFLCITQTIYGTPEIINGEQPIVVVVCSYNNSKWSKNTLNSIFSQNYTNFRVIIVDDCSTDSNVEVIQKCIDDYSFSDRVTFIKNDARRRKLFNLYRVLYDCHDDEIVFMVDGDDSINGHDVLAYINDTYKDDKVWFTYGQYRNVPASQAIAWGFKEMGYCRPVPKHIQRKQAYREYSFIYTHPRSFRAWLFKMVKLADLIAEEIDGFKGDFYPAANDVAMYFPMVEMAHMHIKFIPEMLYIRNLYSDIVGFKVDKSIQVASAREIRKKSNYSILFQTKKYRLDQYENASADIFLLCRYNLTDIETSLNNVQQKISGAGNIYLFFNNTADNKKICRFIKKKFPNVIFIPCDHDGNKTLKARLLEHLSIAKNEHILITTDTCSIVNDINLSDCILWLEKTFAYRFYLNRHALQQDVPKYIPLTDNVCAWKMRSGSDKWKGIHPTQDSFICRKTTLYQEIKKLDFNHAYGFLRDIHTANLPACVGLFPHDEMIKGKV
jgi:glycosyltransferase involved in cell wall biosynthesis